jgi:hypothetical protein
LVLLPFASSLQDTINANWLPDMPADMPVHNWNFFKRNLLRRQFLADWIDLCEAGCSYAQPDQCNGTQCNAGAFLFRCFVCVFDALSFLVIGLISSKRDTHTRNLTNVTVGSASLFYLILCVFLCALLVLALVLLVCV